MNWADVMKPWPGEPERCRCQRMVVATLEETLGCPSGWYFAAGIGWVHGGAR